MRVSTTDLQNAFGKYLSLVQKEDIVVVKNGKVVAKLVHYIEPDFYVVREEAHSYKPVRKISYDEYLDFIESSDQRYEFIDGVVYLIASPGFKHQVVVNEIAGQFYNYFKGKPCRSITAPLDIRLFGHAAKFEEDPNVVQPDIVVICDEDKVDERNRYVGVPALVVEVLSPSTRGKDMAIKLNLYMKSGVQEYWIVDPENKKITRYSFTQDRDIESLDIFSSEPTVKSTVFEGLELTLSELFSV